MGFLLWLLLQQAVVSVWAVPTAQVEERSAGTDLVTKIISGMVTSFDDAAPTLTDSGALLIEQLLTPLSELPYCLAKDSPDAKTRAAIIDSVREKFVYSTLSTGGPYYPAGELGVAKNALDSATIHKDLTPPLLSALADGKKAFVDSANYSGLHTLEDYDKLYDGEWLNTMPNGTVTGVRTNYTQDLYFSMQRLSTSPFRVRRLRRGQDGLPFDVDASVVSNLTGLADLETVLSDGRLFYASHRDQLGLNSTGRYAAACDAYFYVDVESGAFLPLAIRTNVGANLVYTPRDSANDWLLAKMMFNVNDFWYAQWNHLSATHYVMDTVWQAAIRTLSREHPVYAILDRITLEAFSLPVLAQSILFRDGGAVDMIFPFSGGAANNYTNYLYDNGAGDFQSNYFEADLMARGLIGFCNGPAVKHIPYYEDGRVIHTAIKAFMTTFVKSYYASNAAVAADPEIRAWVKECTGDAKVHDFPTDIATIETLVDVLTHVAHLVSTAHHAVNTNELIQVSSTLPFNPASLYSEPPTTKSNSTDVVAFLPPLEKVVEQFIVTSLFARPQFVGTKRTLTHMFHNETMLGRMNAETRAANDAFMATMEAFSAQVSARAFDGNGLSQGMPFLWKALDPNVAPYSVAI